MSCSYLEGDKEERLRRQLVTLLPKLRSFARGLTGSMSTADDLVQTTCERALTRWSQWRGDGRLDGWVFRIAYNLWQDQLRTVKAAAIDPRIDPDGVGSTDGVKLTENSLQLRTVRRLIDNLPLEQRVVLLLVSIEGMSYRETSEALDIPIGTVMSRLSRARASLIEQMDE